MNLAIKSTHSTLEHLSKLVSFDTQNPPRKISTQSDAFKYLIENLPGFQFEFIDAADGCIALLAKRGNPQLLFNFHIDTVPVTNGWHIDPFQLTIKDSKAFGLGSCDIKGAVACMLSAVNQSSSDVALLFSSDEEHGSSMAVKAFLKTDHGFKKVVVAEPTQAKAVIAHRGIQTAKILFKGQSGHGSEKRALTDSAIHKAIYWSTAAIKWVSQDKQQFENLSGTPFNIGTIKGGMKSNMIASDCEASIGFRSLPGENSLEFLKKIQNIIEHQVPPADLTIEPQFTGPTLPAANQVFSQAVSKAKSLAEKLQLNLGTAVNFWTEASLFSQAGLTAIVFGPGNIEQAHTADEWVDLSQLDIVEKHYLQILNQQLTFEG